MFNQPGAAAKGKRKHSGVKPVANEPKQARLSIIKRTDIPEWNLSIASTPISNNPLQNKEEDDLNNYFEVRTIKKTFNKKFNLHCDDHQARFKNMEKIEPSIFPLRVHDIMDKIFKDVIGDRGLEGRIRVCMDADGLNRAYNGPFMEAPGFDHERVIGALCKILNSNENVMLEGGEVRINIIRADMPPKASGKTHRHMNNRTTMDLTDWAIRKRSLVTIINEDELCMARALVVGIAAVQKTKNPTDENVKHYNDIRKSKRALQKTLAEKLHDDAGVPRGPCGVDEAKKFQDFLNDYQILIYAAHTGNKRIFTGPPKQGKAIEFAFSVFLKKCNKYINIKLFNQIDWQSFYNTITITPSPV